MVFYAFFVGKFGSGRRKLVLGEFFGEADDMGFGG